MTHGIKSPAILFGARDRLIIGLLQLFMIALFVIAGILAARGPAFYLGVALGAVLFAYQQWLIREREPRCCFEAFLDNNRFGMGVFAGLLADYFVTP